MKLRVHLTDVVTHQEENRELEVTPESSIASVIENLGYHPDTAHIEVSHYYSYVDAAFDCCRLPYISVGGVVRLAPELSQITVRDFFSSHGMKVDEQIHMLCGWPQAGGVGLAEVTYQWQRFYPVLEHIVTTLTFISFLYVAVNRVKRWFRCSVSSVPHRSLQGVPPGSIVALIFSRAQWNPFDLASTANISLALAKNFLRLFCYKWNRSCLMYERTKQASVVLKLLQARTSEYTATRKLSTDDGKRASRPS